MERLQKEANRGVARKFFNGYGESIGDWVKGGGKNYGLLGELAGLGIGLSLGSVRGAKHVLVGK